MSGIRINSIRMVPGSDELAIGWDTTIKLGSQGYLGYSSPQIAIDMPLQRTPGINFYDDEYPKNHLTHTHANLGLGKDRGGLFIFEKGMKTSHRLFIKKVHIR